MPGSGACRWQDQEPAGAKIRSLLVPGSGACWCQDQKPAGARIRSLLVPGSGTCWCQDQEPACARIRSLLLCPRRTGANICLGEVLALIRTMPADGLEPFDIYLLGIVRLGWGGGGEWEGRKGG